MKCLEENIGHSLSSILLILSYYNLFVFMEKIKNWQDADAVSAQRCVMLLCISIECNFTREMLLYFHGEHEKRMCTMFYDLQLNLFCFLH